MSDPKRRDREWEEEQAIWDADQNDDPETSESITLEEFRRLAALTEPTAEADDE